MAHFYGTVHGNGRTASTRGGTKSGGLYGDLRGHNVGVVVRCFYDEKADTDVIKVYRTKGSNGPGTEELLFTLYENERVEFAAALRERFGIEFAGVGDRD